MESDKFNRGDNKFDYSNASGSYTSIQSDTNSFHNFLLANHPDYIQLVSDHWLKQEAPIRGIQIFISVLLLVICLIGNFCQILVMIAYSRSRELCTASNRLLISLLSADFLLLVNCYMNVYQGLKGFPVVGRYGCLIYGFNSSVAALAEIWSLAAVSYDRSLAIYNPLDTDKRITKNQSKVIITSIWTMAILFSIFPLVGWNKYVSEAYFMGCAFDMFSTSWNDRSYVVTLFVLCWCIPLGVILVAYVSIFSRVRQSGARNSGLSGTPNKLISNNQYSRKESRASTTSYSQRIAREITLARMSSLLLAVWVMAWTPYVILIFWVVFLNAKGLSPFCGIIPTLCCKIGASANAMIYGLRLPKFKEEIRHMIDETVPICISSRLCGTSKRSRSSSRDGLSSRRQSSVHCNDFQKHQDSFKIAKTSKQTKPFDLQEMDVMQHS